ncbi:phosphoesterase PA-phosphatase [Acidovorax sp. Leaf76]|uniref:phosphatase PAP2 family protein n=1 Tax=unclassified Acidovorax TaxID=2684926 RepID=UPI0007012095|nr:MULTISPECIES: phosphatase PAP2 family protein [unclassified Acidovorax]KQO26943.1 phosphoesterase PA-phosphatase [Acidovorax sp. Leaf76]KQO40711.1 phosphoesterase PA-phosphatase [Acidovorax sp. Leaf84]KQS42856.1 phosphoesterase PA-phosphatase [Acidovorax sp. Leaf191]
MLPLDLALFHAVNADASTWPAVVTAARWASQELPIAMGGVLAGGLVVGSPAQRRDLVLALFSMALAWVGVQLLRHAIAAPRPAQLGIGVQWIEHAARAGFPGMHTAAACALAASLQASRPARWLAALCWVAALAIAWSRVCLGVHFPFDVLAGMLTGALSAGAVHALGAAPRPANRPRRFSAYWSRQERPSARHR